MVKQMVRFDDSLYQRLIDLLLTIEPPGGQVKINESEIYDIQWNRYSDDLLPIIDEF